MKRRNPNTDWNRPFIGEYMSSVLHHGKGIVSLWMQGSKHFCITKWHKVWNFLYHQGSKLSVSARFGTFRITRWHKVWNFLYHRVTQGLKLFVSPNDSRFETLYHRVMQGLNLCISKVQTFYITECVTMYMLTIFWTFNGFLDGLYCCLTCQYNSC